MQSTDIPNRKMCSMSQHESPLTAVDRKDAKIGFVSLGCPKALVDSERILTQLRIEGYQVVGSYEDANLVVVNTCGFIDSAVEESLDAIGEALDENGRVIVTGCLGVRVQELQQEFPKLLAITGPQAYEEVMEAVHDHLPPPASIDPRETPVPVQGVKLTPRHYAYLKISEGCNHRCRFCIIPSIRGDLASRSAAEVLGEAERLVEAGVRELLVVSQDTGAYGVDIRYQTSFWNGRPVKSRLLELAENLGSLDAWVRLHYVYPYPHIDDIIPLMADGRILPYLDIPFQHGSPSVLKSMKRPAAAENNLERILAWRTICPELTIRSTFVVGFPGETDTDFNLLLTFLKEAELDRVGCFEYSPVDGAAANELPNQVPDELKAERYRVLMALQAQISAAKLQRRVGSRLQVLVDSTDEVSDQAVARSKADAPEIDGHVYIENASDLVAGEFAEVEIVDASEHDLFARLI